MNEIRVTDIYIYPVKGLSGFSVKEWNLSPTGLAFDRQWMVVDEEGTFMSQREIPEMCLLHTSLFHDHLVIKKDADELGVLLLQSGQQTMVKVWDDFVDAIDMGEDAASWLSRHLKRICRLVRIAHSEARMQQKGDLTYPVSFTDACPVLLVNETSLSALNKLLQESIAMNRFRANIYVSGLTSLEEEQLSLFSIGGNPFQYIKPCGRCQVITIDPNSGIKSPEPLTALANFNKVGNSVRFGVYVKSLVASGLISVGDLLVRA